MLMPWLAILGGFALLVWSAERFVFGASGLARNLGVSPLIIGMTIMGFGTSAPEMLVSGLASANGNPGIGIGNALGSNIANIGLVIGATALIMPLAISSRILRREYPVLIGVTALAGLLMMDDELGRLDGVILISGTLLLVAWLVWVGKRPHAADPLETEFEVEIPTGLSMTRAVVWTLLGLVVLVLSSRLLVWGAVDIARDLGISDLVIGLTIIAVGTSLPELAASVMSAIKKEHDMAIGNIIGSNMFNLLAVLALPGLIQPSMLDPAVMQRDYLIVVALTLALFIMAYGFKGRGRVNRLEGGVLLACFASYMTWLGLTGLS
jgi:cation:H+ antiporter